MENVKRIDYNHFLLNHNSRVNRNGSPRNGWQVRVEPDVRLLDRHMIAGLLFSGSFKRATTPLLQNHAGLLEEDYAQPRESLGAHISL